MHKDEPANLTIAETVTHYRIGRTKLYSLIAQGDIEAVKLGSRTLILSASIREFFERLPRVIDR